MLQTTIWEMLLGTLTFNGGTLLSTTGFTSSRAATLSGSGTVEVTGTPLTMSGVFSGAGPLTKSGSGHTRFKWNKYLQLEEQPFLQAA